jgi:SAM-dependent methyltransferase
MTDPAIVWHDLECGAYTADLELWRSLASHHAGDSAVLDIGSGSGRVALALARSGSQVIALERDALLAAECARRAADLPVTVICADACAFTLDAPVPLAIVPMQTVHLLEDRPAFLRCARAALRPGGLLALALLGDGVAPFDFELDADTVELDGVLYASTPTALRQRAGQVVLERRRSRRDAAGEATTLDVICLTALDAATLVTEGAAGGFALSSILRVPPTDVHAGSEIVILEATR